MDGFQGPRKQYYSQRITDKISFKLFAIRRFFVYLLFSNLPIKQTSANPVILRRYNLMPTAYFKGGIPKLP